MHYNAKRWRCVLATALSVASIACISLGMVVATSSGVFAGTGITLDVTDCSLRDVVKILVSQSGSDIIVADDANLDKRITASIKNKPLESILDSVVRSAGVAYHRTDDGTYIIGGPAVAPVLEMKDIKDILPPVTEITAPVKTASQEIKVKKIMLRHACASELLRSLGTPNVVDSGVTLGLPSESVIKSNSQMNDTPAVTYYNEYGTQYNPLRNNSNIPGSIAVPTSAAPNTNTGAGRTGDLTTGAGQGYPGGYPGARPTAVGGTTTPGTAGNANNTTGGGFWNLDGITDTPRAFDLDNSILVKGTEEGIEKFREVVQFLDVAPKQVSIKAEFVDVSTTDIKNFGIDWNLNRLDESFATSFVPGGNVIFGMSKGNITAQIRAQLTSDVRRVISSPIISTLNMNQAVIAINQNIPYWETVSTVVGNNVVQNAVARSIQVSNNLVVTPRVNGDGTITMMISPQVADASTFVQGPSGYSMPITNNKTLQTIRRIQNGETIVVGGFVHKTDSRSYMRVPFLSELPIIGKLFETSAKKNDDVETLIFVTATIIPDVEGAVANDTLSSGP